MATKDGFPPDERYLFLTEQAEETVQPDIGKALGRAALSLRILKASIFGVMATAAVGIAILSVENPVALVADITASWVDKPALQPGTDASTSSIQSIADTQDLPTTTSDAPTRDEIAVASEPADQKQTEIGQPSAEALLKEFEAWAAKEDSRAQVVPVQPAQAAPVQVAQDAPAQAQPTYQAQPTKKHRRARSVHNARAEIRTQRNQRARVREEQNARVEVPAVPDARAQEQSVQNAQTPSLLQSLGLR
ncbi:hypothetical protein [Bradyrhizobium valentinum]|uniref:Uncharacterized protein n=1 Tax=Bradyrhizobium valentinum TaxID=1518501 RepID=A0A0R3LX78_9BRAD|nr:hypothetical protein [Bradyrhizobium valentinum]KRR11854.1 hypothetical protein CP49_06650 [Bradyrhizobium valentinum]